MTQTLLINVTSLCSNKTTDPIRWKNYDYQKLLLLAAVVSLFALSLALDAIPLCASHRFIKIRI